MEIAKKLILGLIIFSATFFVGAFYRATWFFTFQKGQFERRYLYRDLAESKLGGQTPQETWNLYLDALAKGDIETAVQYWVPEKRSDINKILDAEKEAGVIEKRSKNINKNLSEVLSKDKIIEQDEKIFSYEYLREKNIDFIGATDEYKKYLENYWSEQKSNSVKDTDEIVFKLNKYTKRWLIKE